MLSVQNMNHISKAAVGSVIFVDFHPDRLVYNNITMTSIPIQSAMAHTNAHWAYVAVKNCVLCETPGTLC